jgi:NADPH-dependent 2,4-dienoyl-CoA reductase/sulfur reductase-like enzyme
VDVDMTVIGAGPVGLYAAYYAGFRGMRTAIVDSLPEPGGQISALYPEKLGYDIAGFPRVRGRDLVAGLVGQTEWFTPSWLLDHPADRLERLGDGRLRITTGKGAEVSTSVTAISPDLRISAGKIPWRDDNAAFFDPTPAGRDEPLGSPGGAAGIGALDADAPLAAVTPATADAE